MTVIKRFNDTLIPTKDKVFETYEKVKKFEVKDVFLDTAAGYSFYNTSPFTFQNLLADSDNIEANFRSFIAGFSENVQDILENFDFDKEITKLANNNALFAIIQEFNTKKSYMGPDLITDLLICEEKDVLLEDGVVKTIYDMTMGTSQMLACMEERLFQLDSEANEDIFDEEKAKQISSAVTRAVLLPLAGLIGIVGGGILGEGLGWLSPFMKSKNRKK